jgi:hypothetical protein
LEDRAKEHADLETHRMEGMSKDIKSLRDEVKDLLVRIETELAVLKRAIGGLPMNREAPSKLKVPEPKPFVGARSDKELENFLWDKEHYF